MHEICIANNNAILCFSLTYGNWKVGASAPILVANEFSGSQKGVLAYPNVEASRDKERAVPEDNAGSLASGLMKIPGGLVNVVLGEREAILGVLGILWMSSAVEGNFFVQEPACA